MAVAFDPDRRVFRSGLALAEVVLRSQKIPEDELRVVLTSRNGELVRRHLELHLERLEERLVAQRRSVKEVERILAEATGQRLLATLPDDRRTVA